jgi:hypothetical protein
LDFGTPSDFPVSLTTLSGLETSISNPFCLPAACLSNAMKEEMTAEEIETTLTLVTRIL